MTTILVPGRHHILTNFQWNYLDGIIKNGLNDELDVNREPISLDDKVDNIIYAVTSANHSNTRRNPIPWHRREAAIQDFSRDLNVDSYVYPIDDIWYNPNYADYLIKKNWSRKWMRN